MVEQATRTRRKLAPQEEPASPDAGIAPEPSPWERLGNTERLSAMATGLTILRRATGNAEREASERPSLAGGVPLEAALQARMEAAFGHPFGHVRVHTGEGAAEAANDLNAAAMALGSHLFFAPGEWAPGTAAGDRLLAHELAHVVQYDEGRVPSGGVSQPADSLEHEADSAARAALAGLVGPPVEAPTAQRSPSAPANPAVLCYRYPHPPADLDRWAAELTAMGISGMDRAALAPVTGDPHEDALRPEEVPLALAALHDAGSGVARGWNHNQDDLGVRTGEADTDHEYWTPLHYGRALQRLAEASGATSYGEFMRTRAARVSLAGAPMRVHPRAVWFVAAAQLGMDRAAGVEEGHHYAAPAALSGSLRPIRRELDAIARADIPRFAETVSGRERAARFDVALVARYNAARADLEEVESMARLHQERDRAADAAEEGREEPEEFAAWLLEPARQAQISAVAAPSTARQAIDSARALSAATDGAPGRDHGMGAMDGHGTYHAMGLAIDYGTSSSSGAENRGIPRIAWRFLYRLMDDAGPPLAGLRPHSIAELEHEDRSDLSDLVCGTAGHTLYDQLHVESTAEPTTTAAERRGLRFAARAAVQQANAALREVQLRLRGLGRGATASLHDRVAELRERIRLDIRTMAERSPEDLGTLLEGYRPTLEELDEAVREAYAADGADERGWLENRMTGAEAGRAPRGVRPHHRRGMTEAELLDADTEAVTSALARIDAARDAVRVGGLTDSATREIEDLPPAVQDQWESDRDAALREDVRNAEFTRWWRGARESGIYSQPDAYVAGIESVHAHANGRAHLEGGHHWDIAPPEIMEANPDAYRASLHRDMATRTPADIDQIIGILDESASGRNALDSDSTLGGALDDHAAGWRERRGGPSGPLVAPPLR